MCSKLSFLSAEDVHLHLPAQLSPLYPPVRTHVKGVSPVHGATATRRSPSWQGMHNKTKQKNPFFVVNVLGLVVIIVYSVLMCLSHINRWEWGRLLPRSSSCWQSGQKPSRTTLGMRGWCGAWRSWPTGWPVETRSVLGILCPHATTVR